MEQLEKNLYINSYLKFKEIKDIIDISNKAREREKNKKYREPTKVELSIIYSLQRILKDKFNIDMNIERGRELLRCICLYK